jgi:SpoVK/Ycf46/Vps4 family AAA+-type ATPase
MSAAKHMIALLKSHISGNDEQFLSIALQIAAHEARIGHVKLAEELRDLIDKARERARLPIEKRAPIYVMQPKGELASLVSVAYPTTKLNALSLPEEISNRLQRVLKEQRHQRMIRDHGLAPRRKLLLVGPPGSGKTMTASALAGELNLPLLTILLEAVITRFMGETAVKLKLIFDAMENTRGVYLFDEFDAIGSKRTSTNDVGEIRRVLNSFLQFLEKDDSQAVIIAATNHPELLDKALFRRFDDVIEYHLPDEALAREMLSRRLAAFDCEQLEWSIVLENTHGLSQADIARAGDDAAKEAVLKSSRMIDTQVLIGALKERRSL